MKFKFLSMFLLSLFCDTVFSQTGPGGVGSSVDNVLWLRADKIAGLNDGDAVSSWSDYSGNSNGASQSTASYRPTYQTNEINGLPVVRFDGTDDYFDDNHSYSARTVFSVFRMISTLQAATDLGQLWGNYPENIHVAMDARSGSNVQGFSFDGSNANGTKAKYAFGGAAYTAFYANTNTVQWTYDQSHLMAAEFETARSLTRQVIGSLVPNFAVGVHQFGGDIAEIIVYNTTLNSAQRILVENYLSSKYNISISNDKFSYDATHGYDVAGIGRVDASNMNTSATSANILTVGSASDLGDNEYLLFGHGNGSIASWTTTEAPNAGVNIQRLSREWRFDETGDVGTVTISIDTTNLPARPSGYTKFVLLIDADGNFSNGASVYELNSSGANEIFELTGKNIADGDYMAIGVVKPTLAFTSTSSSMIEGTGNPSFTAAVNYIPYSQITFHYSTADGTAVAPADYTSETSTLDTIPAGSSSTSFSIEIIDDPDPENSENFTVTLSNPSSGVIVGTDSVHTFTIQDDDNASKISFNTASANGSESSATVQVQVNVSPVNSSFEVAVDYSVTGGTATGSGTDYTLANGTLNIPIGASSATFDITINDDDFDEDNETIIITLSNPQYASLSVADPIEYTYTINDDDATPTLAFTATGSSGNESVATLKMPVVLSAVSGRDVQVNYTLNGTASGSGADYTLADGTLTISAGNISDTLTATINDDSEVELTEYLVVTLSSPVNASLGSNTVYTYTITDNDENGYLGPGGVGDASSVALWLRADKITGLNDGDAISISWNDVSGNGNDASQSTSGYRPIYKTNVVNGRPVVRFDGVDDFLDDNRSYDARTVFIVFRISSSTQPVGELGQAWGNYPEGVQVAMDPRTGNVRGFSFDGGGTSQAKYELNGAGYSGLVSNDNSSPWSYDQFQMVAVEFDQARPLTRQVIGSLYPQFTVGTHQYGGDIAEIIVYSRTLTLSQKNIVENYLAAKYGLTISNDKYAYQSTHSYDVSGIGQEGSGTLHTSASSAGIFLISNPSDLDSSEYLLFGHDDGAVNSWTATEAPFGEVKRIAREWRLDETGDIGTVTLSLDTSLLPARTGNYKGYVLMVDGDGDFSAGATVYPLTWVSGSTYKVDDVDVADGQYITIGTARYLSAVTGNFNSNSTWLSGTVPGSGDNTYVATGTTITLTANQTVGSIEVLENGVLNIGSYTVSIDNGGIVNNSVIDFGTGTINYSKAGAQDIASLTYSNLSIGGTGTKTLAGNIVVNGNLTLSGGTLDVDNTGNYSITVKGNWVNSGGTFEPRNGTVTLNGSADQQVISNGQPFYNLVVNNSATEITISGSMSVSNVLTLTDGVITTGTDTVFITNWVASSLAAYSNASFINGYLSRSFASNLSTYVFPLGNGTSPSSYYRADIYNLSLVGINYIVGKFNPLQNHDDNDMSVSDSWLTYNTINTAGIWILEPDAQPVLGTYDIRLYTENISGLQDNDFGILKRPAGSLSASAWTTGGGLLNDINGLGRLVSDGFMLRTGLTSFSEFGAGEGSGAGLPIKLVSFTAQAMDKTVELNWITATEIHNDFFTIERSGDGITFEELAVVEGAGNSSVRNLYSYVDERPYTGISYYRLKQTDFDGAFTYSDIASVSISAEPEKTRLTIGPNPLTGKQIFIQLSGGTHEENILIKMIDLKGRSVYTNDVIITPLSPVSLKLPAALPKGIYILAIENNAEEQFRQRLVLE